MLMRILNSLIFLVPGGFSVLIIGAPSINQTKRPLPVVSSSSQIKSYLTPTGELMLGNGGFENAMLVPVLAVEVAPMQTSVVDSIAVPRFHDVDFAILGPLEGVFRQQPESRPDTSGHRRRNSGRQTAPWSAEGLVTRQSGAGKLLSRVGMPVVDQSAHNHRIAWAEWNEFCGLST
jgi:hypothetical protein